MYPILLTDADGNAASGDNDYIMHFDADGLPPVRSFWSARCTTRTGSRFPTRSTDSAIGDRDPLQYNDDGSLDLYVQNQNPGQDKHANWLPTPRGPIRHLYAAVLPNRRVLHGNWAPPPLRKLEPTAEGRSPHGSMASTSRIEEGSMAQFDITETNVAVERLLDKTQNPRHRYLLTAYNRHRYLEMAGRYTEIFAPEMTVEHPVYRFDLVGLHRSRSTGKRRRAMYHGWAETNQSIFYVEDETLAVGDNMIVSQSDPLPATAGIRLRRSVASTPTRTRCTS